MPIKHNSEQSQELEDFYQEAASREAQQYTLNEYVPGIGQSMLRLLTRINELFSATQLWGLTSHYRLVVQNADNWKADWLVFITAGLNGSYSIEYLLPSDRQPWPGAYVRGEAPTLAEAERYLLIAMRECGGWPDNAELAARLIEYGLA